MGSARPRSTTGLHLLDAQHMEPLSGTVLHQDQLRWYAPPVGGPPSQVEVELLPAPIWFGPQAGWWGIEARIDGQRVGELTQPVAGWYLPLVDGTLRHGGRPGVEAHVVLGEFGSIDVELYFPVLHAPAALDADPVPVPLPRDRPVPLWMGVAAAGLLVTMVASLAADRITRSDPTTASPAADTRLSLAAQEPPLTSPAPAPSPEPAPAAVPAPAPAPAAAVTTPRSRAAGKRVPVVAKPRPTRAKATSKPKPTSRPEPTEPEPTSKPKPTPEPPDDPTPPDDPEPPDDPQPPEDPTPPDSPSPPDDTEPPSDSQD